MPEAPLRLVLLPVSCLLRPQRTATRERLRKEQQRPRKVEEASDVPWGATALMEERAGGSGGACKAAEEAMRAAAKHAAHSEVHWLGPRGQRGGDAPQLGRWERFDARGEQRGTLLRRLAHAEAREREARCLA